MSSKIKILDSLVVDQIAAGEVVERPSSVAKELIENSIDAGAKNIKVLIEGGGIGLLVVSDDGEGMSKEDLAVSVERFATSKLRIASDLERIVSFGFRGEALPSIASVSQFSVKTRQAESETGYLLEMVEGGVKKIYDVPCPFGTSIEVKDLFYNLPARKKFLKSDKSESSALRSVVSDFALARPDISFQLQDGVSEVLSFGSLDSLDQRIRKLNLIQGKSILVEHSRDFENSLGESSEIKIGGIIPEPLFCPKIGSKMRFLVNGRIVKSALLMRAVRDGYESLLKPGYYPSGLISVDIDPSEVDVNVHPQKIEVRFRNEGLIFSSVRSAVSLALKQASSSVLNQKVFEMRPYLSNGETFDQSEIRFKGNGGGVSYAMSGVNSEPISFSNNLLGSSQDVLVDDEKFKPEKLRFLGQVFKLYLIFTDQEKIGLVDMHAAHERVTFYRLKSEFVSGNKIKAEPLLFPISIPLDVLSSIERLEEKLEALDILGIQAELRNNEIIVRAMSKALNEDKVKELISELLEKAPTEDFNVEIVKRVDSYLARLACHGSLRRGREIKSEEAYELMDQLEKAELSGWCPHGRPVIWWLKEGDLERQFGRVQ